MWDLTTTPSPEAKQWQAWKVLRAILKTKSDVMATVASGKEERQPRGDGALQNRCVRRALTMRVSRWPASAFGTARVETRDSK